MVAAAGTRWIVVKEFPALLRGCAVARLRGCAVARKKRHQMFQVFSSAAPVTFWERQAYVNILFETFLQQPMRLVFES